MMSVLLNTPKPTIILPMNTALELPKELEIALINIATRENRTVNELVEDALRNFTQEHTKPIPSWVGIAEGSPDLSQRVDELLFQDGLRP